MSLFCSYLVSLIKYSIHQNIYSFYHSWYSQFSINLSCNLNSLALLFPVLLYLIVASIWFSKLCIMPFYYTLVIFIITSLLIVLCIATYYFLFAPSYYLCYSFIAILIISWFNYMLNWSSCKNLLMYSPIIALTMLYLISQPATPL